MPRWIIEGLTDRPYGSLPDLLERESSGVKFDGLPIGQLLALNERGPAGLEPGYTVFFDITANFFFIHLPLLLCIARSRLKHAYKLDTSLTEDVHSLDLEAHLRVAILDLPGNLSDCFTVRYGHA
ncbi:MAG: hypothetical protein Q8R07_04230, partial [Candidatus Uhrbacteria bacterium]|nr:hypothetical protein [Candidatus Uhrbacteria bacterium]